ncbi:MAG: response regulator [Rhodoferax sp.]|jgi:CheY-like chemotaxis protein|nr:response regulator [Rhodoferax sp.]
MPTILIVDDRPVIRRLIAISLGTDYEILEAEDGVSALALIHGRHPQYVFLDVMMNGPMDGLQLLDEIKGNPLTRDIQVAMVTGRGLAADSEDALKRGADAYFVKPFGMRDMLTWVQSAVK